MKRLHLLDTNIVSLLMRNDEQIAVRVNELPMRLVAMSVISEMELQFGIEKAGNPERLTEAFRRVLAGVSVRALPAEIAPQYARLRNELERRGSPIGPLDTVIAAHALAEGAVLVTPNIREFRRVKGLRVEAWAVS